MGEVRKGGKYGYDSCCCSSSSITHHTYYYYYRYSLGHVLVPVANGPYERGAFLIVKRIHIGALLLNLNHEPCRDRPPNAIASHRSVSWWSWSWWWWWWWSWWG